MLTKADLKNIDGLIQKRLKSGLIEFYETLIMPYFEHNEKDHKEMRKEHNEIREELKEGLQEIGGYMKNYEKRIGKLEAITAS